MPSTETPQFRDLGLLTPVAVGHDASVGDDRIAANLVAAEHALVRAWEAVGEAPAGTADAVAQAAPELDLAALVAASVSGGNPVIPLVGMLKADLLAESRAWVHRGATSQDILDTALVLTARDAGREVLGHLEALSRALGAFLREHRDDVVAARTLTQHAVPTTVGLRTANWWRGVARAQAKLADAVAQLPAQLGGAGGTLAAMVERSDARVAARLAAEFAAALGLEASVPWHTQRWPVTELGDALAQVIDAVALIANQVATLSRTEIGELAEGAGGGSSAMPQKRNPAKSVLIRSAAIRAPHLAATLHSAAAMFVDERPDGAWHAEWPALRELLRLALGATANAAELVDGLKFDAAAAARNLAATHGLIVSERLNAVVRDRVGADRLAEIVGEAVDGGDLTELLRAEPALEGVDVDALLDPAQYTGLADELAVAPDEPDPAHPAGDAAAVPPHPAGEPDPAHPAADAPAAPPHPTDSPNQEAK